MAIRVLTRITFNRLHNPIANSIPPILIQKSKFSSPANELGDLFQRYGFPPSDLNDFLSKNRFLLNSTMSEVRISLNILSSLCPCENDLVSIVNGCPGVLELEFLKKWELGFREIGIFLGNGLVVQNVLEVSRKFDLDPDDLSSCLQCLRGLGFSETTIIKVLELFPMVITMNEVRLSGTIEFLCKVGFRVDDIDCIIRLVPGILAFSAENKLEPLFAEFKDMGFTSNEVRYHIVRNPRVLGLEMGELSKCLGMLKTLKCREPIKKQIFHEGAFRAGYEVKLRIDCLCKHGLICRDAFGVLWREPRIILYDVQEIEKKIEFLVSKMKFDIGWLIEAPEYLGMNFEKQIIARYKVIEYLRSKGGLGDEVGLKSFVKLSRLKFYNLYVKPYPECEKMYGRFAEDIKAKSAHPVGMWKLFKPPNYPQSEEDLNNIKTFMDPSLIREFNRSLEIMHEFHLLSSRPRVVLQSQRKSLFLLRDDDLLQHLGLQRNSRLQATVSMRNQEIDKIRSRTTLRKKILLRALQWKGSLKQGCIYKLDLLRPPHLTYFR